MKQTPPHHFGAPSMPFQAVKSARRGSTDRRQKPTSSAAPTDTALRLFQSRPCYPPPISSAQAERRRYGFGTASMSFRQRPRAPPAAARARQHKQADKRRLRHFAPPPIPFRRRSRLYSNAAPPKQQRKKPDGNRFTDSARQCRRSKSWPRRPSPRRPRRTTAQKKYRTSTAV